MSPQQIARYNKLPKRMQKELKHLRDETYTEYSTHWTSWGPLVKHFEANNKDIRLKEVEKDAAFSVLLWPLPLVRTFCRTTAAVPKRPRLFFTGRAEACARMRATAGGSLSGSGARAANPPTSPAGPAAR